MFTNNTKLFLYASNNFSRPYSAADASNVRGSCCQMSFM